MRKYQSTDHIQLIVAKSDYKKQRLTKALKLILCQELAKRLMPYCIFKQWKDVPRSEHCTSACIIVVKMEELK